MPMSHLGIASRVTPYPALDTIMPITFTAGGVTLHIDRENECYYVDVAIDHEPLAGLAVREIYRAAALEANEDEAPVEMQEDGTCRLWLFDASIEPKVAPTARFPMKMIAQAVA